MRRWFLRLWRRSIGLWEHIPVWLDRSGVDEQAMLLLFAAVGGALSASGVIAFYWSIDLAYTAFFHWPERALAKLPWIFYRPLATAAALAAAAWLWQRAGRGSDGITVPDVQVAVVHRGGRVSMRGALARTAASAITIGGGGSAGSEGPVAVLGAAAGSTLGRVFRFSPDRVRVLVGAGAAAGISAAFNAPLAGAFFALEEILGAFRGGHFAPVVVASVTGAVMSRAVFGNHPAFELPKTYNYDHALEVLWAFPLLGLLCGVMSVAFVRTHFWMAERLRPALARLGTLMPWVAGAVVGAMVLLSNGLLVGVGHLAIPLPTFAQMAWPALLALAVGKIVATSLTLQLGGSGGLFTPSLYIGAAVGSAFAVLLHQLLPGFTSAPEAYALVAMGAVVAATTAAPITATLLVFEITGDYAIVPPLMIAVAISQLMLRRLSPDDLYSGWLRRRGEHLSRGSDHAALERLTVRQAFASESPLLPATATVPQILELFASKSPALVPVVDEEQRLLGVLTSAELGAMARTPPSLDAILLAADVAVPSEHVLPSESLQVAVRRMGVRGHSALPVVDEVSGRVLGIIDRGHILEVYERAVTSPDGTD